VAIAAGTVVGGLVFSGIGAGPQAYVAIFLLSAGLRALTLVPLFSLPRAVSQPRVPELRTLAVRPGGGSLDRPILASLDVDDEATADTSSAAERNQ
jgi:hypothetical protein